jgi:hypothetical protein
MCCEFFLNTSLQVFQFYSSLSDFENKKHQGLGSSSKSVDLQPFTYQWRLNHIVSCYIIMFLWLRSNELANYGSHKAASCYLSVSNVSNKRDSRNYLHALKFQCYCYLHLMLAYEYNRNILRQILQLLKINGLTNIQTILLT